MPKSKVMSLNVKLFCLLIVKTQGHSLYNNITRQKQQLLTLEKQKLDDDWCFCTSNHNSASLLALPWEGSLPTQRVPKPPLKETQYFIASRDSFGRWCFTFRVCVCLCVIIAKCTENSQRISFECLASSPSVCLSVCLSSQLCKTQSWIHKFS